MRKAPSKPPADLALKTLDERSIIRETRTYRFLTYVMGGGVKVNSDEKTRHQKERDKLTPVRVASIRGQLRFWWRACNPQNCKTVEELWDAEAKVWGSAEEPSCVNIIVKVQPGQPAEHLVYNYVPGRNSRTDKTEMKMRTRKGEDDLAYGAFPLQPSSKAQRVEPPIAPGVLNDYGKNEFAVEFVYRASVKDDIEWALWAWETFGGLGARTRRGFGAIERVEPRAIFRQLHDGLRELHSNVVIQGVPSLAGAHVVLANIRMGEGVAAWLHGLKVLRQLRQGKGIGRNLPGSDSTSPAGRSRWPEPEQIRRITAQRSSKHSRLPVQVERFPRAVFGMPIVFHFQGGAETVEERGKDPVDTELKPAEADRMASPLILRPMRDGNEFRAGALVLNTITPKNIVLKIKKDVVPVQISLEPKLAEQIEPMKSNGNVFRDPLDRFLEELKKS